MKSASDNNKYPAFCELASKQEEVFAHFRQNKDYQEILEHFSYEDGLFYISEIKSENESLLNQIEDFKTSDNYGGPEIFDYGIYGFLSASTLHYIRQLSYLETYFGDLNHKNIVEIGGGYGGLAKVVIDRFDIESYTIYDLPEVNQLTKKYLGKFGDKYLSKVKFGDLDHPKRVNYDICVSNCAFTECTPAVQDLYIDKVIKYAESGFMLYNYRVESYHPVILLTKLERAGLKNIGATYVKGAEIYFILAWNCKVKLKALPYRRRLFYKISPALYTLLLKTFRLFK